MSASSSSEPDRGCYLYGIVHESRRPLLDGVVGVGDAPVSLVTRGPLAAVVAAVAKDAMVPRDPSAADTSLARAVLGHESVLDRCLESGPVLPMRFATTFRSQADVLDLLDDRRAEFEAVLDSLRGRREWGLKALLDQEALTLAVRAARPDLVERELALDRNAPGAAYFARKRLIQEQAAAGDVLVDSSVLESHERLCAIAVDAQLTPVSSQIQPEARRICLNAAYLVDDSALDRFRDALNALQQEHATFGLRYELTGPWPAYNFVPVGGTQQ